MIISEMTIDLKKSILSDDVVALAFSDPDLSGGLFLVGGYLRDLLSGRVSGDRDFVSSGNPKEIASRVSELNGTRPINLGHDNLHRCLLKDGGTADFTAIDGTLEHDLMRRDFTVNAMAWSKDGGLIDLHGGVRDIHSRMIRMIREENLVMDPVRIVRAYRMCAELGFQIEGDTRSALKRHASLLSGSKPDRVTLEFLKILKSKEALATLEMMLNDGVLNKIIYTNNNRLTAILEKLHEISENIDCIPLNIQLEILADLSKHLDFKGVIFLEVLLIHASGANLALMNAIWKKVLRIRKAENLHTSNDRHVLFDVFTFLGRSALDYLVISGKKELFSEFEVFCKVREEPIIEVSEIQEIAGIEQGKEIGMIKNLIEKKHYAGDIKNKEQARAVIKAIS